MSDLTLTYFDPKLEIIVALDASKYSIGAVVLHKFEDGKTKLVAHVSSTFLAAEEPTAR